jgi:hypothetical protein
MKTAGVDAPIRVIVGDVARGVVEHADQEEAGLIVIGRGAVTQPFGRLRTHAFGIIRRARCPVISV